MEPRDRTSEATTSCRRGLSAFALLASGILTAGPSGACSSARAPVAQADASGGAAGSTIDGGGVSGGSAGSGGNPADSSSECRGSDGSPTIGKGCGCREDCDFGENCLAELDAGAPGGLCIHLCNVDGTCPEGFGCVEVESGNPNTATCFQRCEGPGDCRTGYICGPLSAGLYGLLSDPPPGQYCVPYCQSDSDCPATGTCNRHTGECDGLTSAGAKVGDACSNVAECAGLICHRDPPWPGGHCSTFCSASRQGCPEGSACVGFPDDPEFGDWGYCLKVCSSPDDCRAGYSCTQAPNVDATVCF